MCWEYLMREYVYPLTCKSCPGHPPSQELYIRLCFAPHAACLVAKDAQLACRWIGSANFNYVQLRPSLTKGLLGTYLDELFLPWKYPICYSWGGDGKVGRIVDPVFELWQLLCSRGLKYY